MEPDAVELRIAGCLLEKQRTTPDQYPLTLNALRSACNQTTNRDPVVAYDEAQIRDAAHRLWRRGWARLASGAGSRAAKYRHLLDEALGVGDEELAILCVLMLRGPQTPGELKQRTDRLYGFADLAAVEDTLETLAAGDFARALPRRPGQKEVRWTHLLGGDADAPEEESEAGHVPRQEDDGARGTPLPSLQARVERLESEVAALKAVLADRQDLPSP